MVCCCSSSRAQKSLRWSLLFLLVIGLVLWVMEVFSCTFILIELDGIESGFGLLKRATHLSFGGGDDDDAAADDDDLQNNGSSSVFGCRSYTSFERETFFDTAQTIGSILGLFGFSIHIILLLLVSKTFLFSKQGAICFWLTSKALAIVSFVSSLLIFSFGYIEECFEDSDVHCTPGLSGWMALANVPVLLLSVLVISLTETPSHPIFLVRRWNDNEGILLDKKTHDAKIIREDEEGETVSNLSSSQGKEAQSREGRERQEEEGEQQQQQDYDHDDYGEILAERFESDDNGETILVRELSHRDGSISIVRERWLSGC